MNGLGTSIKDEAFCRWRGRRRTPTLFYILSIGKVCGKGGARVSLCCSPAPSKLYGQSTLESSPIQLEDEGKSTKIWRPRPAPTSGDVDKQIVDPAGWSEDPHNQNGTNLELKS